MVLGIAAIAVLIYGALVLTKPSQPAQSSQLIPSPDEVGDMSMPSEINNIEVQNNVVKSPQPSTNEEIEVPEIEFDDISLPEEI